MSDFVIVIAGTRNARDSAHAVARAFYNSPWSNRKLLKFISGGGGNIDNAAKDFAIKRHTPFQEFPADWTAHGKAAGPIRNRQMADVADAGVIVWDGESRGAFNMLTELLKRGKPVYVERCATHSGAGLKAAACDVCHGSGEIVFNKHGGDPAYDQSKPCPECSAQRTT
jgi:predicted Rossmann fold nucleotide-binding protein DprA/Smf involved in DNA uptake